MNNETKETAWMYCRECDKFDADGTGICSGMAFDFEITDGNPPCKNYNYKEKDNE